MKFQLEYRAKNAGGVLRTDTDEIWINGHKVSLDKQQRPVIVYGTADAEDVEAESSLSEPESLVLSV